MEGWVTIWRARVRVMWVTIWYLTTNYLQMRAYQNAFKVPVSLIFDSCIYCLGSFFSSIFCSTHSSPVSSSFTAAFEILPSSSVLLTVFPITTVEVDFAWKENKDAVVVLKS